MKAATPGIPYCSSEFDIEEINRKASSLISCINSNYDLLEMSKKQGTPLRDQLGRPKGGFLKKINNSVNKLNELENQMPIWVLHRDKSITDATEDDVYNVAHCISHDRRMSAGVALKLKNFYPVLWETPEVEIGDISICFAPNGTRLLSLVTKNVYNNKLFIDNYKKAVENLSKFCLQNNVTRISIPRMGAVKDWIPFY